ncbi:MAG: DNA-processing protein DprA [Cognatishimia sp.]|uniref:DNA-processing protein DprA n=1 Tax=Cognatishimia sp. TaxID=2211648 RepID=UPI003B8B1A80
MTDGKHSSNHPQLPPTSEEDRILWLRLLRSRRVGPATFHRLLREFGNVAAAFDELPNIAKEASVKDYAPCEAVVAIREMEAAKRFGAVPLFHGTLTYPEALYDLPDAPPLLWAFGDTSLLMRPQIALVGARNASSLGTRMARSMAKDIGQRGHVIVSGMARGIDAAAHAASLESGTIAVFGGGIDVIYPVENSELAKQIGEKGLILSEQPMGLQPRARHFPQRNRIISGLSKAVVVVEASAKSGTLITAKNALDQGRDVFAVPGHPIESRASGCNMLIRDGATLIRSGADVIEALAPIAPIALEAAQQELRLDIPSPLKPTTLRDTALLHRQIIDRVSHAPIAEDSLIRELQTPTEQTASALVDLELAGRILRTSNGLLTRIS